MHTADNKCELRVRRNLTVYPSDRRLKKHLEEIQTQCKEIPLIALQRGGTSDARTKWKQQMQLARGCREDQTKQQQELKNVLTMHLKDLCKQL